MDEHVRKAITNSLKFRGIDVLTVQEDNRTGTHDPLLLERATELNRVIFTVLRQEEREGRRKEKEGGVRRKEKKESFFMH